MNDIYVIFNQERRGEFPSTLVFCEVEDTQGNSLAPVQTGATWNRRQKLPSIWALGPFSSNYQPPQGGVDREQALLEKVVEAAEKLTHALGPGGYVTAYDELTAVLEELDQLRGART